MPFDPQYLRRLVTLALSITALALIFGDPELLSDGWLDEEEQHIEEEEFHLHMASQYLDLLPNDQYAMYNLFLDNIDRNESNLMLDAAM
ncbi:uncharacterized protein CDAR_570581 [Caerostris darwini]|uniref:Uncharacterized protein n=1 Tax=Caerostris darwini TaxID=1538125 RepID=A0AAV4THS1_9ARAC|nr:uncharacterized protein CDAR_570581 [Caerostris darwini]